MALCAFSLAFLVLAACSGGNSGSHGGGGTVTGCPKGCPNDPPYSATDNSECVANVQDPACGTQARALYTCMAAKVTCDSSGMTDQAALMAACGDAKAAWETCQTADGG
jgi:hypothetical protein